MKGDEGGGGVQVRLNNTNINVWRIWSIYLCIEVEEYLMYEVSPIFIKIRTSSNIDMEAEGWI